MKKISTFLIMVIMIFSLSTCGTIYSYLKPIIWKVKLLKVQWK